MSEEKKPLTLEEAITTALIYENNVRDMYVDASERATEEVGQRIFRVLAKEEQGHVDYLEARLREWKDKGKIEQETLETLLPSRDVINEAAARLENKVSDYDWTLEIELLRKARQMEAETGGFYKRMVAEMDDEGVQLFREFLEIEDAHYDLVQIQLDSLNGGGFWYDSMEFDLEGA